MIRLTAPAFVVVALLTGCSSSTKTTLNASDEPRPTDLAVSPSVQADAPTVAPVLVTPSPTQVAVVTQAPKPTPTVSRTPSPRPSPRPTDDRPTASVTFVSHVAYAVEASIGDKKVVLQPGQVRGPYLVHVAPSTSAGGFIVGSHTGREVRRLDDHTCGAGDSDYLRPDSKVTFKVVEVEAPDGCYPDGKTRIGSPTMKLVVQN